MLAQYKNKTDDLSELQSLKNAKSKISITFLELRVNILPAYAPLNKKKGLKDPVVLSINGDIFDLHLQRVQLSERVQNSLADIFVNNGVVKDFIGENSHSQNSNDRIIKILCTFSDGAIPLSWKQSVVFSVTPNSESDDKRKSTTKFSQLLNLLVEINQNLVVDLTDGLAILQPLTCSLAILTYLKQAFFTPMREIFQDGTTFHLSKKMVASLLDKVMSIKNNVTGSLESNSSLNESRSDIGAQSDLQSVSDANSEAKHPITPSTKPKKEVKRMFSPKISKHFPLKKSSPAVASKFARAARNTKQELSKSNTSLNWPGKVPVGTRTAKRKLEDSEISRSPKRIKFSPGKKIQRTDSRSGHEKLTRTGSNISWRAQLILEKSQEARKKSFMAGLDDESNWCFNSLGPTGKDSNSESFNKSSNTNCSRRQSDIKLSVSVTDLKSKDDLLEHLFAIYKKPMAGDETPLIAARSILKLTTLYFTEQASSQDCSTEESKKGFILDSTFHLLTNSLLSTSAKIREKYKDRTGLESEEVKLKELQLQVILNCEVDSECSSIAVCCDSLEERQKEVVAMLRTISFIKDPNFLSTFLYSVLLENYQHTSPRLLYRIYDELLHPLPQQLEYLMSPDKLEDEVFMASPPQIPERSFGSLFESQHVKDKEEDLELEELLQRERPSRMSTKSLRSISFHQSQPAKIEIPVKKTNIVSFQSRRSERIASATKIRKSLFQEKEQVVQVRRSLFGDKKLKSPSEKNSKTPIKSEVPAHHVLKTKHAKETPLRKQGVNRILKRQEKLCENMDSSMTWCVEDTPGKELPSDEGLNSLQSLSQVGKFYSNKNMTTRFANLELRMTEIKNVIRSPVTRSSLHDLMETSQTFTSPKRRMSTKVLFSSVLSPSPPRSTVKSPGETTRRLEGEKERKIQKENIPSPLQSPLRRSQRSAQKYRTPDNKLLGIAKKDVPSNLLNVKRALMMSPSPTSRSSVTESVLKNTSPSQAVPNTPSPKKLRKL